MRLFPRSLLAKFTVLSIKSDVIWLRPGINNGTIISMNVKHYTYRISWSSEDQEYVGLCAEYPSLSWLAADPAQALAGIMQVVADVVKDMQKNGEPVPEALADKKYSGEFRVRVPPMVHRNLAISAAEQGVSMNRYISAKLAG